MVEKTVEKTYSDLWELSQSNEEIIPFFKWESEIATIVLERPIASYDIVEKNGKFGLSKYIVLEANGVKSLFRVDSVRLRKALLEASEESNEFPKRVQIIRSGLGFNTEYNWYFTKTQLSLKESVDKVESKKAPKNV